MDIAARKRCARCGKRLKKEGSFYVLKAELVSSFDGYLPENDKSLEERLAKIENEIEGLSEEELAEQVYKKFEYFVCGECRDEINDFLSLEGKK